jgi:hypothetical protein
MGPPRAAGYSDPQTLLQGAFGQPASRSSRIRLAASRTRTVAASLQNAEESPFIAVIDRHRARMRGLLTMISGGHRTMTSIRMLFAAMLALLSLAAMPAAAQVRAVDPDAAIDADLSGNAAPPAPVSDAPVP